MHKILYLTLICLSFSILTFSQQPATGSLTGAVKTAGGEKLASATLLLTMKEKQWNTTSNEQGIFYFNNLTPGRYVLKISYAGYADHLETINIVAGGQERDFLLSQANEQLEEVLVSTQKRLQSRVDVPIAVSAISGPAMNRLNIRQYDELAQYVPGLQMQLQSPNNPSYVIRGITSDEGDTRTQHRVSVFQDGVSMSRSRGSVAELFDMERVEVVKGPQGTLFGRGAQIGAVHLIQNKPTHQLGGELQLGYGNWNQQIANGYINTPLGDKFANRFAFFYNQRDGFIDNKAGGDLNGRNVIALRNTLRFQPSAATTADLIINYQHDNYPGTSFKSMQYAPAGGDTAFWSAAALNPGKDLYIKRDVLGLTLLLNHQLSSRWDLASITGYRQYDSDEAFDADGTNAPVLFLNEMAKGKQFSQEFRFNYDDKKRFSGFFGASFFHENASTDLPLRINEQSLYVAATPLIQQAVAGQLLAAGLPAQQVNALIPALFPIQPVLKNGQPVYVSNLPDIAGTLAMAGIPLAALPVSIQQLVGAISKAPLNAYHEEWSHDYGKNTAYEIFADGTYKLAGGLSLTAGLRGSYEKQMGGYQADPSAQPGALGILMGNYPNLLWTPTDGKYTVTKDYFSYVGRVALNYIFGENNVYASVSRGRRPGVIMLTAADTTFLQPEIVWSYEAGVKGRIAGGKLGYDLAVYYYDWSHFQSNSYELRNGSLVYVSKDAGKAHSLGLEAALQYQFLRQSHVFANWACIDGQFNEEDEQGNKQEYAGNTFRLTPKNSFSAGVDLNLPLQKGRNTIVYVRPSYTYKSKVYFENSNRADLSQDGFGLLNATAGIRWTAGRLRYDVTLFGRNLADEKYLIDAGNTGDAIGMPTYIAGNRRTLGLMFKLGF
ncbi:MAG: TonB-dependent receptor [Candidatus Pseudobacter hemicellulosilyticus]|uniref:TonB-dependent receptor n=1 Tax=Candidatus Pseudobacter hemicellulosilyticus TaxID=3121375 RepID=A0AAJ5WZI2_9BACT|nr:MAG: TonB-dependent receptor [Pseudobacter sp.]